MSRTPEQPSTKAEAHFGAPADLAAGFAPGASVAQAQAEEHPGGRKVSKGFIALMVFAAIGANIAFITPLAISLALRVQQLASTNEEYLGIVTALGAAVALVAAPIAGVLSDRTRTRWGRRSPWLLGGAIIGTGALVIMAAAPNVPILALGWCLAQLGWGTATGSFMFIQADRVPESQRGSVAGLMGFSAMAAPVLGSVIGAMLVFDNFLLFLVPGVIGLILVAVFALTGAREDTATLAPVTQKLTMGSIVKNFVFNPREQPDFGWNWLGRFLFMFGLTLNTTFTTFFIAQRAGTDIAGIAGLVAAVSLFGVLATALGALGSGWLSDRIKRRKMLVLLAGFIFAAGTTTMALAPDLTLVLAGSIVTSLAVGIFSAIDSAIILDIIPNRATDAGRYSGIAQLSISLAQALAPLAAAGVLLVGVTGIDKNYTLLFLVAGVITVIGALTIFTRVKGSR